MFATQMFDARRRSNDGLGNSIVGAKDSATAVAMAGIGYNVVKERILTASGILIPDKFATVRDDTKEVLGVVGNQYTIVQNAEAVAFTDELVGMGMLYETAGYFGKGEKLWLEGILPGEYKILGDDIAPYVVFMNTHDGSGSVKVALTFTRVICSNTLNLAIKSAKRCFSFVHKGSISAKIDEARQVLGLADTYMKALNDEMEKLAMVKISPIQFEKVVLPALFKVDEDKMTPRQIDTRIEQRAELRFRYQNAPDLQGVGFNGARLIQAVADYVDHNKPLKETKNWRENRFAAQIQGNEMLDKARDIAFALV